MIDKRKNPFVIIDTYGDSIMVKLNVTMLPESLKGEQLRDTGIREKYNINVLVIIRGDEIISDVGPKDIIKLNDKIIVFGTVKDIKALFHNEDVVAE